MGINAICFDLHSKCKIRLCGDSVEFFIIKRGCADSKQWALNVEAERTIQEMWLLCKVINISWDLKISLR